MFGISDKRPRQVVGSAAFDQPERTRKGLIEKLKVMVDFQLYEYNEKRVLVFDVASRPLGLPVQADGVAWWYEGDSLIPMPEDVRRKIYEETGVDFSGTVCAGARFSDIDENAVEVFRKKWIEKSGNTRLKGLEPAQLLRDCEAITEEGITYAALILFGKRSAVRRFLPQAEIVFEYRSSDASGPASQREEFQSGFFSCYDRIWELINLRNFLAQFFKVAFGKTTHDIKFLKPSFFLGLTKLQYHIYGFFFCVSDKPTSIYDCNLSSGTIRIMRNLVTI